MPENSDDVRVRKDRRWVRDSQSAKPQEDTERINSRVATNHSEVLTGTIRSLFAPFGSLKHVDGPLVFSLENCSSAGSTSSVVRRIYVESKNIGNTTKAQFYDRLSLYHHCQVALKSRVIFIFLKNRWNIWNVYCTYCIAQNNKSVKPCFLKTSTQFSVFHILKHAHKLLSWLINYCDVTSDNNINLYFWWK